MTFEHFVPALIASMQQPLPGWDGQKSMAPMGRSPMAIPEDARESAVLLLWYPVNDTPHLSLIRRPEYPGVHSGQIALPGGQREAQDKDLMATALRETHEEIGVPPAMIQVIGHLTELYIPPSNFRVQPYVALCKQTPAFVPEAGEVAEVLAMSFAGLHHERTLGSMSFSARGQEREVPCMHLGPHNIWGATAMMLAEFKMATDNMG